MRRARRTGPRGQVTLALAGTLVLAGLAAATDARGAAQPLPFSAEQRAAILGHGPWPPPPAADPGTGASGHPQAVALGQQLFFDARLSPSGRVACASCHVPALAFADGRPRSAGLAPLDRHAPTLWDSAGQRWQGWDGAADSLWSQAIRPLLDAREMGSSAAHVRRVLQDDAGLACRYRAAFGVPPQASGAEAALVHAAKALGAFVATLVSPRSPFDRFRDALARGDAVAVARYPAAARRGLLLFVGRGNCALCHAGPRFSNGEFADIGLPFFVRPGVVDPGRHGGIEALRASPYNRLSRWADRVDDTPTRHVQLLPRNFGEFKVPSLRRAAQTAPYMHDGRLATLADVVRHYSALDEERLHADGERILRPLHLDAAAQADLVAFLHTLAPQPDGGWQPRPLPPCR